MASSTVLSLCAGGGGLDLGVRLAIPDARTVCFVENEVTACAVLVKNMADGGVDDAPLWTDLRSFDGIPWRATVDWVIGGYPCQPFSNAGRRLGAADPRHLWPDVERIVSEVQPEWCFFENVGAHLRLGFYEVARSLQGMGYRVAAVLLTAEEVGAPHGRERLFILAHREGFVQRESHDARRAESWSVARGDTRGESGELADTERSSGSAEPRQQHQERAEVAASAGAGDVGVPHIPGWQGRIIPLADGSDEWLAWPNGPQDADGWRRVIAGRPDLAPALEPEVCDVVNGVAGGLARSDQLHILGNGVVPAQAAYALRMLLDAMESA